LDSGKWSDGGGENTDRVNARKLGELADEAVAAGGRAVQWV